MNYFISNNSYNETNMNFLTKHTHKIMIKINSCEFLPAG